MGPPAARALRYDVSCSPTEARNQLRNYFSTKGVRTGETTTPDNKSFEITTDPLNEPRSAQLDRRISYRVDVEPAENANAAVIGLSRATVESKGTRERDWYEGSNEAATLQSEQELINAIKSICRGGQQ